MSAALWVNKQQLLHHREHQELSGLFGMLEVVCFIFCYFENVVALVSFLLHLINRLGRNVPGILEKKQNKNFSEFVFFQVSILPAGLQEH